MKNQQQIYLPSSWDGVELVCTMPKRPVPYKLIAVRLKVTLDAGSPSANLFARITYGGVAVVWSVTAFSGGPGNITRYCGGILNERILAALTGGEYESSFGLPLDLLIQSNMDFDFGVQNGTSADVIEDASVLIEEIGDE